MDREAYLAAIKPAMDIVVKKHQDYNSGVQLEHYFPFGHVSYIQMLHVKHLRLLSLVQQNTKPNFESMEDTVKDLLNYTVFYMQYLQKLEAQHAQES